ncbi:IS66-like element accessory protein TnpA, partial [Limimaricola cinnabarinus]|uniref:IS66-like element accessory protein TnpA n=1 Tax=Limimaricola cinnabarinus TaxID=1125964 RepID=UPI0032B4949F
DHSFISQVEVLSVTDTGRRRRWTDAEKVRIVEESYAAPRMASATARRYEISRSLLTRWRREAREGLLATDGDWAHFSPVAVAPSSLSGPVATGCRGRVDDAGRDRVEIHLPNGRHLVIGASTEPALLARLIQLVERA